MTLTIILILSFLVALNFVLLKFSCNKSSKKVESKEPETIVTEKSEPTLVPNQLPVNPLAPTGS